tara:strand:- start:1063 stop:2361 length:1299 start_codon:yes stop_codon:yes gene_type:complete
MKSLEFIDLFAGLGGTRIGFEQACEQLNIKANCVYTSEIKDFAVDIYKHNFNNEEVHGDITQIDPKLIPDFDILLGGFPCQAFSNAGKRHGFDDTRGTLFYDVARIIAEKKPQGFLLENVEGLVTHDRVNREEPIGNTLITILSVLQDLNYHVEWKVLNSKEFGVPQERKRIYIVGSKKSKASLNNFTNVYKTFSDIQEKGLPALKSKFTDRLLERYSPKELMGKAIKDKRGGKSNIHSWDLELKGPLSSQQKKLMRELLKQRRKKDWAISKQITWMDGMPLTIGEIHSFFNSIDKDSLKEILDDLVHKNYLKFEHPKDLVRDINGRSKREYATHAEKGYNIVTGKLSFELNRILNPSGIAPTIVATEADRLGVIDSDKIRRLSERECLRFFGFPEEYKSNISHKHLYDLIGNTVVVPVIKQVSLRLLNHIS